MSPTPAVSGKADPPGLAGILVVDKPAGMTSHDVVARVRRRFGLRRVGHGGTLDPGATGVLVLGLGRATRLLRFVTDLPKSYAGEVVFGMETSTLDDEGEVTARHDMSGLAAAVVEDAAARFVGRIEQVPPMVSAVKVGGRRLHELARAGVEVERVARPVDVYRFSLEATADPMVYRAEVECSSGTYVRVLAADVGAALGGGAHLRALRRTAIGPFSVEQAVALDDAGPQDLLPLRAAVDHLAQVSVDAAGAATVLHGRVLKLDDNGMEGAGPWAVSGPDGGLLAVYEGREDGTAKPMVVVADQ